MRTDQDPFADLRDKRMGELDAEQTDRATELWLREQIGPSQTYWHPHLQSLFRVIDRLREQGALYTWDENQIADACMSAEIPDSKYESLMLALHYTAPRAQSTPQPADPSAPTS